VIFRQFLMPLMFESIEFVIGAKNISLLSEAEFFRTPAGNRCTSAKYVRHKLLRLGSSMESRKQQFMAENVSTDC